MELSAIKNKQDVIVRRFKILTVTGIFLTLLPLIDGHFLTGRWALTLLGLFTAISSYVVVKIFSKRSLKMRDLKSGRKLLAHTELDGKLLQQYAKTLHESAREKNKALIWIMGGLFTIISIPFLFFLKKDEMFGFVGILGSIFLVIFIASKFFPWYYYRKNLNGDRQILIGEKYAYINGYFHNWDFPLSGLTEVKIINNPFHGIQLTYYYTDRTFRNAHEIKLPVPDNFDSKSIIENLKKANNLK